MQKHDSRSSLSVASVRSNIVAAFAEARLPATEDELGVGIDPGWPNTVRTFLGKRWDEVSVKSLVWRDIDPIYNLRGDGLKYYIQSYLVATLDHPPDMMELASYLASSFVGRSGRKRATTLNLSDEQRDALAEFFEWCDDWDLKNGNSSDEFAAAWMMFRHQLNEKRPQ